MWIPYSNCVKIAWEGPKSEFEKKGLKDIYDQRIYAIEYFAVMSKVRCTILLIKGKWGFSLADGKMFFLITVEMLKRRLRGDSAFR